MNTLFVFAFDTEATKEELIIEHSDKQVVSILFLEDGGGELTFSDMSLEKYINELETQNADFNLQIIELWETLLDAEVLE